MSLKICTILGTRPEIIKMSRTISALDDACDHVLVHTGQNADPRLKDVFFSELRLRKPDYYLDCDTSSLASTIADIFVKTERLIDTELPDAVIILGDTNSALAAIIAKRKNVPVVHLEAGNRAFDDRVPEEINRRLVDSIATINCVYTEHARRNLLAEGRPPNSIYLSGSPMREVLDFYIDDIAASSIMRTLGLKPNEFLLLSLHRQENVDSVDKLASILRGVTTVADSLGVPVVATAHPRTRVRLTSMQRDDPAIRWCEPFGLFDYCSLQMNARCVISDSGTISEEAAILGFPAVSPRDASERPEGLDAGSFILTGTSALDIVNAVAQAVAMTNAGCPAEYEVTNFSQRIVSLVCSTGLWR